MAKPLYKNLTVQVLTGVVLGAAIGALWPTAGKALAPLGEGFIRLVKMVVAPIIFLTVVAGIARMGDLKKAGRVGGKALIYFEVVTTLALAIGLLVGNVLKPGAAAQALAQAPASQTDTAKVETYTKQAKERSAVQIVMEIIPSNVFHAFSGDAKGEPDLLQILFFAVICGIAMAGLGMGESALMRAVDQVTAVLFRIMAMIMNVAALGALGAIAGVVGAFGLVALKPLFFLMLCVYLTMALFIFVVLGVICRLFGFSLWAYLKYIREEIILVLGTSSSEVALPRMMEKLELMGCGRSVVGMVIPAGYSFNLDGTSIYLSMAVLFIAQAYGGHLRLQEQVSILFLLMLTSKGAAAVTGAGFVTLAATLYGMNNPALPVAGLVLLVGVDRFMSEARAITNLIGNGVATIVVSKVEKDFDPARYRSAISGQPLQVQHMPGFPVVVEGSESRP